MTDKEYTYDIDKYTIGVDENGEDGIGLTIAIIKNGKINFLGNCYGENARCIDLLIKENKELKSQLRGTTHCFDEEEHNKLKEEITDLSKEIDMWNAKYNDMFDENKRLKEALEAKSYCKYANKCDELDDCSREEYENMANANVRLKVENCDLKEENQELKLELSGYRQAILNNKEMLGLKEQNDKLKKKYENAVADYETTMFEKEQLNSLVNSCQEKIRQLKKQLENYKKLGFKYLQDKNNNLETQQKEFIKWLEDYINLFDKKDIYEEGSCDMLEEILQKYRSIIGDDK